jgi:hypothetical protein
VLICGVVDGFFIAFLNFQAFGGVVIGFFTEFQAFGGLVCSLNNTSRTADSSGALQSFPLVDIPGGLEDSLQSPNALGVRFQAHLQLFQSRLETTAEDQARGWVVLI